MEQVLSQVPRKVTDSMNAFLCKGGYRSFVSNVSTENGYPAHFFQRSWNICGEDITRAVLGVLNGNEFPDEINSTFIVLIPNVPNPNTVGQFRLISLSNVVYKIISTANANRLKTVLPDIISKE
jgi:hypothetical protein